MGIQIEIQMSDGTKRVFKDDEIQDAFDFYFRHRQSRITPTNKNKKKKKKVRRSAKRAK